MRSWTTCGGAGVGERDKLPTLEARLNECQVRTSVTTEMAQVRKSLDCGRVVPVWRQHRQIQLGTLPFEDHRLLLSSEAAIEACIFGRPSRIRCGTAVGDYSALLFVVLVHRTQRPTVRGDGRITRRQRPRSSRWGSIAPVAAPWVYRIYVSKINPDLLDPLPSFKRSAKVPETIRSLHERNPELCRELMANRPRFSDPTIKSFWGHLEAAWEDAILGYSWRWPEKDAPYRVEMTEDDIQSILAKCKWIRSLRM